MAFSPITYQNLFGITAFVVKILCHPVMLARYAKIGVTRECLNEFSKQGWDVSEFFLSEKIIKPCIGCDACVGDGVCVIN